MIKTVEEGLEVYRKTLLDYKTFCEEHGVGPVNEEESMIQMPYPESESFNAVDEGRRKREIGLRGMEEALGLSFQERLEILRELHVTRYDARAWPIW